MRVNFKIIFQTFELTLIFVGSIEWFGNMKIRYHFPNIESLCDPNFMIIVKCCSESELLQCLRETNWEEVIASSGVSTFSSFLAYIIFESIAHSNLYLSDSIRPDMQHQIA